MFGGGVAVRSPGHSLIGGFLHVAGGPSAKIAILTCGSEEAAEINGIYWQLLADLGATQMVSPIINNREEADLPSTAAHIAEADAVFVAGGAQSKLIERLAGTASERAMIAVLEKGGLLSGTSCGASIYGNPVILDGGTSNKHMRPHMIEICAGFNIMGADIMVDTHCSSRGRFPRILSLLMEHPQVLAIGLDEDTAIYVEANGMGTIWGYNAAYIFDATSASADRTRMAASGMRIHCLRDGDRFDLPSRTPIFRT